VDSPISIRFPDPLRDQIASVAASERRTFSSQVRVLVEDGLRARSGEERLIERLRETLYAIEVRSAGRAQARPRVRLHPLHGLSAGP
jgi:CopG-like RHH_1 or ribbon-helix-helix domain, RHH_5